MPDPEVRYWSNSGRGALPTQLVVDPGGVATLTVCTNRDTPGKGAVGLFRTRLDARQAADLVAALRSPEFAAIPKPPPIKPGGTMRRLSIKEEKGEEVARLAVFGVPPPPAFKAIEKQALDLVAQVRKHPVRAMAIELGPAPDQVDRGKEAELKITLKSTGIEAIPLPHPSRWDNEGVRLALSGSRSDIPPDRFAPHHRRTETLSAGHLAGDQAAALPRPVIPLKSVQPLELVFRIALDWPPGDYNRSVVLGCALVLEERGAEVGCELYSSPVPSRIVGKRKRDDEPRPTKEDDEEEP